MRYFLTLNRNIDTISGKYRFWIIFMSELLLDSGLQPEQMKSKVDDFMDKIHDLCKILHMDLSSFAIDHILAALGVKVKLSSPQGDRQRLANPTVAFKWQGVCLKLHPYSLRQVIESERLA